jgi:hypothetical protein
LMFAHIYIICTSRDLCHQFPVLQAFRKSRRSGHRNTICIIALSLIWNMFTWRQGSRTPGRIKLNFKVSYLSWTGEWPTSQTHVIILFCFLCFPFSYDTPQPPAAKLFNQLALVCVARPQHYRQCMSHGVPAWCHALFCSNADEHSACLMQNEAICIWSLQFFMLEQGLLSSVFVRYKSQSTRCGSDIYRCSSYNYCGIDGPNRALSGKILKIIWLILPSGQWAVKVLFLSLAGNPQRFLFTNIWFKLQNVNYTKRCIWNHNLHFHDHPNHNSKAPLLNDYIL